MPPFNITSECQHATEIVQQDHHRHHRYHIRDADQRCEENRQYQPGTVTGDTADHGGDKCDQTDQRQLGEIEIDEMKQRIQGSAIPGSDISGLPAR